MKILRNLLGILLLLPTLALAEPMIAPESVLKKAAVGRSELREVVMSLNFNAAEMRDVETFESYFFLLDDLQSLAKQNGFEDLYPGVIETLGVNLTSQGMRWLSIVNSSEDKLKYYLKWMNSTGVGRFLSLVEYELKDITNPEIAKKVAHNIDVIMPIIEQKAGNIPYITLGYQRIKSDAAVALLKMDSLTEMEAVQWISKIALSSSASEYLDYLNQDIFSYNKSTIAKSHKALARLQALLIQTRKLSEIAPGWLITSIGESITETLARMIRYEEKFDAEEFETALGMLSNRQFAALSVQIINLQSPPNKEYVNEFMRVANLIIQALYSTAQVREGDDLKKALARVSAPVVAQKYSIEGHYKLNNGSKKNYYFTIASSKENALVAAFVDENFNVAKSFFNVTYNSADNTFVASEREPDLDHNQNLAVKFVVHESGKITLVDPYIREGNKNFTGTKIQSFPKLGSDSAKEVSNAQGTYAGEILAPGGTKMKVKLIVTSFNGYTVGRIDSSDITIDLAIGSTGTDGSLILTSGKSAGGSWFQLRSAIVNGGLQTTVVIGGKGMAKSSTFLKKVSN